MLSVLWKPFPDEMMSLDPLAGLWSDTLPSGHLNQLKTYFNALKSLTDVKNKHILVKAELVQL